MTKGKTEERLRRGTDTIYSQWGGEQEEGQAAVVRSKIAESGGTACGLMANHNTVSQSVPQSGGRSLQAKNALLPAGRRRAADPHRLCMMAKEGAHH